MIVKEPKQLVVPTAAIVEGNLWRVFPAINVDEVKDIPVDYPGPIGVPITFIDKWNPQEFEVVCLLGGVRVDDRELYKRICIRNLKPQLPEEIDLVAYFARMGMAVSLEVCEGELPPNAIRVFRKSVTNDPPVVNCAKRGRSHSESQMTLF